MTHRRNATAQAQKHWVYEAHHNEDACALAASLNLRLPRGSPGGVESSLQYPMRRLVVTGKDTPGNMLVFFGVDSVPQAHSEVRKFVILNPRPRVIAGDLDDGCPYWAPRPASREERAEIERQTGFGDNYSHMLPYCLGGQKDRPEVVTPTSDVSMDFNQSLRMKRRRIK